MDTKTEPKTPLLIELLGWYGMAAVLIAYGLGIFGVISYDGLTFPLLNLTGAIALMLLSWCKRATQTVVLNVAWALIAIGALIKLAL